MYISRNDISEFSNCTVSILVQDQNSNSKKTDQFKKESVFRLSYNSFNIICNSLEFMCECMYSV